MKILILGASSFIGSYLKKYFEKEGYSVLGTYQTETPIYKEDSSMLSFQMKDGACTKLLEAYNPDIVFYSLRGDFSLQLVTVKEIIHYIKSSPHKRFVFLSSLNVFDNDLSHKHLESDPVCSDSDYGIMKGECEKLITSQLGSSGIILRIPQVYEKVCPRITRLQNLIIAQKPIETFKNLYTNFTTCEQIAHWTLYILTHHLSGIFHVGTDDTWDYMAFDQALVNLLSLGEATYKIQCEFPTACYQAVIPGRSDIPSNLHTKISDLLNYLGSK